MKQVTIAELRNNLKEFLAHPPFQIIDGRSKAVIGEYSSGSKREDKEQLELQKQLNKELDEENQKLRKLVQATQTREELPTAVDGGWTEVEKCEWPEGCKNPSTTKGPYTDWDATFGEDKTLTLKLCQFHYQKTIERENKYVRAV